MNVHPKRVLFSRLDCSTEYILRPARFVDRRAHTNDVQHVSWAPDGSALVSAGIDNESVLWDSSTTRAVVRLEGHRHYVQVHPPRTQSCIEVPAPILSDNGAANGPLSLCQGCPTLRPALHRTVPVLLGSTCVPQLISYNAGFTHLGPSLPSKLACTCAVWQCVLQLIPYHARNL